VPAATTDILPRRFRQSHFRAVPNIYNAGKVAMNAAQFRQMRGKYLLVMREKIPSSG